MEMFYSPEYWIGLNMISTSPTTYVWVHDNVTVGRLFTVYNLTLNSFSFIAATTLTISMSKMDFQMTAMERSNASQMWFCTVLLVDGKIFHAVPLSRLRLTHFVRSTHVIAITFVRK